MGTKYAKHCELGLVLFRLWTRHLIKLATSSVALSVIKKITEKICYIYFVLPVLAYLNLHPL
jgi:hypothetical protein